MTSQEDNLIHRLTLDRLMEYYYWITENLDPDIQFGRF